VSVSPGCCEGGGSSPQQVQPRGGYDAESRAPPEPLGQEAQSMGAERHCSAAKMAHRLGVRLCGKALAKHA
jgi:hypothetical protein